MKNWKKAKEEMMSRGIDKAKQEPTCCILCGVRSKLLHRVLRHKKANDICGYIIVCEVHKNEVGKMAFRKIETEKPEAEKKVIEPISKRGIIKKASPGTFKRLKDNFLKKPER